MPQSPAPIRNKQKQKTETKQKQGRKNFRKAQKEHRKPIRPAKMYKKIIMQKNMQKNNLCRPGMQLPVYMPYKALKRPTMAFYVVPLSVYLQRLKRP